jgi:hypothetical protein
LIVERKVRQEHIARIEEHTETRNSLVLAQNTRFSKVFDSLSAIELVLGILLIPAHNICHNFGF